MFHRMTRFKNYSKNKHKYTEQVSTDASARALKAITFIQFLPIYPTHWFYPLTLNLLFQLQGQGKVAEKGGTGIWHPTNTLYRTLSVGRKISNWNVLMLNAWMENKLLNLASLKSKIFIQNSTIQAG